MITTRWQRMNQSRETRTPEKLKKKALMAATGHQGMAPTRSSSPGLRSRVLSVAPAMVASNASALAASARDASLTHGHST